MNARNVAALSAGLFQYPYATLSPATQISPTSPSSRIWSVTGSTILIRMVPTLAPELTHESHD